MNINNTINGRLPDGASRPEESIQTGRRTAARGQVSENRRAASYEGSKRTAQVRSQNGLDSGIYKASGDNGEQGKNALEEVLEQGQETYDAIDKSADTMTEEDCEALEEEGMSLEAYEAERLNRALARIKENRVFMEDNLEGRMDKHKEYDKEIQKIALKNKISDNTARKLGQKLIDAGLPVTEANIVAMVQALNLGGSVTGLSDNGMAHMIGNHQEATIENIHNASYAGAAAIPAGEEVWEAVKGQVEEIIEKSGQPATKEALENGRWLLDHELPVTEETLEELENLKGIRVQADEDYLLDRMVEAVRKGRAPKEANLDLETVRTRRKLEEIRLSMSEEASQELKEKGIIIDTEHIKEVIEELRNIEKEYHKALLTEAGELPEADKVNLLEETLEKADAVGKGPAYVLGRTLATSPEETLETLYQAGKAMKQDASRLEEAYEPLWTAPRRDMGDSIQKAFQNTGALLSGLGLEATEENQRAVRILGYNRMEITEENINRVKAYDAKVNEVLNGLKPAVAVELIRRGENPLDMSFDKLRQSVNEIKETIGAGPEEKYSTYLWKLEKQGGEITEAERKSYIGIYRLLNNIEKTDGAAIGAVLNTDRELTLSNLLTAVRTLKNKGINQTVDDETGGFGEITFSSERISDQIDSAFRQDSRVDYLQSLVERTMEEISPEQVKEVFEKAEVPVMNMGLESFCENVRNQEKDERLNREYHREQMETVQRLAKDSEESVAFLEAYGGTKTIQDIQAAQVWFTGDKNLFKEIDRKADNISEEKKNCFRESAQGLLDSMEDEESLQSEYQNTEAVMKGIAAEAFSNPELLSDEAGSLRLIQKGIALAGRLSRQEHYEMPVVIGEEVSSLSLTILKGTLESGKAEIRVNFPEQGVVEAELTVKNNEIKGFILCETTEGQQLITGCLEEVKAGFEGLGLTVKQINVSMDRAAAKPGQREAKQEDRPTETKILYQAAKILVKQTIERTQVVKNEN